MSSSCASRPHIGALACLRGKSFLPGNGGGGVPCSGPLIDREPQILSSVVPEYTQQAMDAVYGGIVVVGFVLQADGEGRGFKILSSLGLGLDEKALEAVKKFTFLAASNEGRPLKVAAAVQISFCLPTNGEQRRGVTNPNG